jgi:hypothetical protein
MIAPMPKKVFDTAERFEVEEYYGIKLRNWSDILGEPTSWFGTSEEHKYELYLQWHNKHFTKLGRYLHEVENEDA